MTANARPLFIPLLLIFPDADIPVIQRSLLDTLDPAVHWRDNPKGT